MLDSHSKCTTKSLLVEFMQCSIAEVLARTIIQLLHNAGKLFVARLQEISTFGKIVHICSTTRRRHLVRCVVTRFMLSGNLLIEGVGPRLRLACRLEGTKGDIA